MGLRSEMHHHEVAPQPERARLQLRHAGEDRRQHADLQVRRAQRRPSATARRLTFMPKPIYGDNGSGMHTHQSIWKGGKPLFAGNQAMPICRRRRSTTSAASSSTPRRSTPSPTQRPTRYKRLIPGFEAPVLLAYSARNRSASCRIPYRRQPKGKRVEVRFPIRRPTPTSPSRRC